MWPFKCKQCEGLKALYNHSNKMYSMLLKENGKLLNLLSLQWRLLSEQTPPLNSNILVANKDFSFFGFLYMDDGWDYSRQINMQGKEKVWMTYTNPESVHWWLNLDEIKK
jgi:hypothetical protein